MARWREALSRHLGAAPFSRRPCRGVVLIALVAGACGASTPGGDQAPRPAAVVPGAGYSTSPTPVEINGSGFLVKATQPSAGGDPTIDKRHRAWLGDAELSDVTWFSSTRLTATVPAGLPLGAQTLTVENAMGERGSLDGAFSVLVLPSFAATVAASRTNVSVGQEFAFTLTVTNSGGTDIAGFSLGEPVLSSDQGARATATGRAPSAPATLAAGETLSFTWTYLAGDTPGALTISVSAGGKEPLSGEALSASPPGAVQVTVQRQASLGTVAAWSASPTSARAGQPVTVTLTVTNAEGAATANVTSLSPSVRPATDATCTDPNPVPSSVSIAGGDSATFTWTCTATAFGSHVLDADLTASDANTGTSVPGPSLTAIPVAFSDLFTVAVEVNGNGGSVASSPAGIGGCTSAGGTCSAQFQSGTAVTLRASRASGWSVVWYGCDSSNGDTCHLNALVEGRNVTASFTPRSQSLSVTASPAAGAATLSCTVDGAAHSCNSAPTGSVVTVSTSAASGYTFSRWLGACTGTGACSFTMPGGTASVTAYFTANPQTLNVTALPAGSGTFSCTVGGVAHDCASAPTGSSVAVSASAAPGYAFSRWSGPCSNANANPCTFTMPAAAVSLTGNFRDRP